MMDLCDDDLDDSALILESLTQKRKASNKLNFKNAKQLKLSSFNSQKQSEFDDMGGEPSNKCEEKSQSWDDILNKSKSSYFENKNSSCPLCLKLFVSDTSCITHMKQCAKKHKMTTQQLLAALELQKKQLKERKALGLSLLPTKKIPKKKEKVEKEQQYDLALGLALSKSLENSKQKPIVEVLPTLEGFGFTVSTEADKVTNKKNSKIVKKNILKERTQEERQRIVTEKAAVILLDEEKISDFENQKSTINVTTKNFYFSEFENRDAVLWNLGKNENNLEWYVEEIKTVFIPLKRTEKDSKNCDDLAKESTNDDDDDNNKKEIKDQEESNNKKEIEQEIIKNRKEDIEEQENDKEEELSSSLEILDMEYKNDFNEKDTGKISDIQSEIMKLKLPKNNIYQDWKKMINNEKFSDLKCGTKDGYYIFLHSVVLFVRCPEILNKDSQTIFKNFNLSTILIFLEFVYCGTLNSLFKSEVEHLLNLAVNFKYEELLTVLNDLKVDLVKEDSFGIIDSTLISDDKTKWRAADIENKNPTAVFHSSKANDKDLFTEEIIDLVENRSKSPNVGDDIEGNVSDEDEYYWKFLEREKEIEKIRKKEEEETENMENSKEREKIERSTKQQHEEIQQTMIEDDESNSLKKLEMEKNYKSNNSNCYKNDSKELLKNEEGKFSDDYVVLSSDSETPTLAMSPKASNSLPCYYEAPYFDPYDDFDNCSPIRESQSQSLITGETSFVAEKAEELERDKSVMHSTPVRCPQTPTANLSTKLMKSTGKKNRYDLTTSGIIKKYKKIRTPKSNLSKNKLSKSKGLDKNSRFLAEAITSSINDIFRSPLVLSDAASMEKEKYEEVTPRSSEDFELEEPVTPYPNYSLMEESSIKKCLSKYGLKRSLGKSKAKKILRHIYEELHPILNIETKKIVKSPPKDSSKSLKKTKSKQTRTKKSLKYSKKVQVKDNQDEGAHANSSKDSNSFSNESITSLDKLSDYNSDGSEFEDLKEPLTQSAASHSVDLSSVINEFFQMNTEFLQKVLLYEPIWLEDLQKSIKNNFGKRFKLTDLIDYLDQQCITFRTVAQKKVNQRRNMKKNSPRKYSSS